MSKFTGGKTTKSEERIAALERELAALKAEVTDAGKDDIDRGLRGMRGLRRDKTGLRLFDGEEPEPKPKRQPFRFTEENDLADRSE